MWGSVDVQTPEGLHERFGAGVRNLWSLGVIVAIRWLCWAHAGGTRHVWGWLGRVPTLRPAPGTGGQRTVRCSARDVASPPAVSKQLWIIIIIIFF